MGTQQLILYTVATVIAFFIVYTMFNVQNRGQEASIDAVQYRAAKQDMLNLVQMIEQDFRNMGSSMYKCGSDCFEGTYIYPQNVIIRNDTEPVTGGNRRIFEFVAQPDSMSPPVPIRYIWEPNGDEVTLDDGTTRSLYTLERFVDGTLSGTSSRISQMTLTWEGGELMPPVANLYDARTFNISIRIVSPLGKGDLIEETQFDAEYRPVGVAITDQLN